MQQSAFGPRMRTTDAPLRGMTQQGNISLNNRPLVNTQDNQQGTIRSMSINVDGKEVLIPTIFDGKQYSEEDAIQRYFKTGMHLGMFDTPQNATQGGKYLSNTQNRNYSAFQTK